MSRAEPQTIEEARRAVQQSRARMSDTLDELEYRLVSKKEQIENRMDVMRPVKKQVRARPWPALAVAFGVGMVLWKMKHRDEDEAEDTGGLLRRLLHK